MDKKLVSIIRSLASQVADAKVIADRMGIKSNSLFVSNSDSEVAVNPTDGDATLAPKNVTTDSSTYVEELQLKIRELTDTIMELRGSMSLEPIPLPDEISQRILQSILRSFSGLSRGQLTGYYNKEYFQNCSRQLCPIVAQALVTEFETRNLVPLEVWTTYLH